MGFIKVVVNALVGLVTKPQLRARLLFLWCVKNRPIDEQSVLIEPFQGSDANGAPFYLLRELCQNPEYAALKKYVVVLPESEKTVQRLLDRQLGKDAGICLVRRHSLRFCRVLASAKYLVSNVALPFYFIKRPGQVYLNTWHGTPLKALGRSVKNASHALGNVQRNFLMADYLLCPNETVENCFKQDYMLDIFYTGSYLRAGYPQNSVFLASELTKDTLSERMGVPLSGKRVVAYMPTWRDVRDDRTTDDLINELNQILAQLDALLDEGVVVLAKPHRMAAASVDWSSFSRVLPFPDDFETYQVLSAVDVLVTDYSSVMYDFLNARKEILLYTYDEEEYQRDRSMYHRVDELPFWHTGSINELCDKINGLTDCSHDYGGFRDEYCSHDSTESAVQLCRALIKGDTSWCEAVPGTLAHNDKKNVLIFSGPLYNNGITTSLRSLINTVDLTAANYTLLFFASRVADNLAFINALPREVRYISIPGRQNLTVSEAFACVLYFKLNISNDWVFSKLDSLFSRERQRICPGCTFDVAVHFTGYDRRQILLMEAFSEAKKIIYVHNDMIAESKTRGNTNLNHLRQAYEFYDEVAAVSEDLLPSIREIAPSAHVRVVPNVFDYQRVRRLAEEEVSFDETSESNVSVEEVRSALADPETRVIVTIGRFSPEKQHIRLFDAFDAICSEHTDESYKLVVIGGNSFEGGYEYELEHAQSLKSSKDIFLIQNLSNPYAILGRCDGFILPSAYEGFGLVLVEADALRIPVVSTDITGPRGFMLAHGGSLVPNTPEGVKEGVEKLLDESVPVLGVDYDEYNREAVKAFTDMIG